MTPELNVCPLPHSAQLPGMAFTNSLGFFAQCDQWEALEDHKQVGGRGGLPGDILLPVWASSYSNLSV